MRLLIQGLLTNPVVVGLLLLTAILAYLFWPSKGDS